MGPSTSRSLREAMLSASRYLIKKLLHLDRHYGEMQPIPQTTSVSAEHSRYYLTCIIRLVTNKRLRDFPFRKQDGTFDL